MKRLADGGMKADDTSRVSAWLASAPSLSEYEDRLTLIRQALEGALHPQSSLGEAVARDMRQFLARGIEMVSLRTVMASAGPSIAAPLLAYNLYCAWRMHDWRQGLAAVAPYAIEALVSQYGGLPFVGTIASNLPAGLRGAVGTASTLIQDADVSLAPTLPVDMDMGTAAVLYLAAQQVARQLRDQFPQAPDVPSLAEIWQQIVGLNSTGRALLSTAALPARTAIDEHRDSLDLRVGQEAISETAYIKAVAHIERKLPPGQQTPVDQVCARYRILRPVAASADNLRMVSNDTPKLTKPALDSPSLAGAQDLASTAVRFQLPQGEHPGALTALGISSPRPVQSSAGADAASVGPRAGDVDSPRDLLYSHAVAASGGPRAGDVDPRDWLNSLQSASGNATLLAGQQPTFSAYVAAELASLFGLGEPDSFHPEQIHINLGQDRAASAESQEVLSSSHVVERLTLANLIENCIHGEPVPSASRLVSASIGNADGSDRKIPLSLKKRQELELALKRIAEQRGTHGFLQHLERWWNSPADTSIAGYPSRIDDLVHHTKLQFSAEVQLRVDDGTLPPLYSEDLEWMLRFTEVNPLPHLPAGRKLEASAVGLNASDGGTVWIPGAFAIGSSPTSQSGTSGVVSLKVPGMGLLAAESRDALDAAITSRPDLYAALCGHVAKDEQGLLPDSAGSTVLVFKPLPQKSNLFMHSVTELLERQRKDLKFGITHVEKHDASLEELDEQASACANSLLDSLDDDDLLHERNLEILKANRPSWFSDASVDDREALELKLTRAHAWESTLDLHLREIPTLKEFAREELGWTLAEDAPWAAIDPDKLNVTVTTVTLTQLPGAANPLMRSPVAPVRVVSPSKEVMSLTEFAIRNAAPDWMPSPTVSMNATWVAPDGQKLSFDETMLRNLVRSSNVGGRYEDRVRKIFFSDQSQSLRNAWTNTTLATMEADFQAAHMQGVFNEDAFVAGGVGRQRRMVEAVIASPDENARAQVDQYQVKVSSMLLHVPGAVGMEGAQHPGHDYPVNGVNFIHLSPANRGDTTVIAYTPGAPDGKAFRVYSTPGEAKSDPWWRTDEGFAYLQERMSKADWKACIQPAGSGAFDTPLTRQSFGPDRVVLMPVEADYLQAGYEGLAKAMISDADFNSTSTGEANWKAGLEFASDVAGFVLDAVDVIPIGTVVKKLMAIVRPSQWLRSFARGLNLTPHAAATGRKLPLHRITKLPDGRIGVLMSPISQTAKSEYSALLSRLDDLGRGGAMTPSKQKARDALLGDLKRIRQSHVEAIDGTLVDAMAPDGEGWSKLMDSVPSLRGTSDIERKYYLTGLMHDVEERHVSKHLKGMAAPNPLPLYARPHGKAMQWLEGAPTPAAVVPPAVPDPSRQVSPMRSHTPSRSDPLPGTSAGTSAGSSKRRMFSDGAPSAKRPPRLQVGTESVVMDPRFPYRDVPRGEWPKYAYHYTNAKGYNGALVDGSIQPSSKLPSGASGGKNNFVYVTTMPPETGRSKLALTLWGKNWPVPPERAAYGIKLDLSKLPEDTRLIRYSKPRDHSWAIITPDRTVRTKESAYSGSPSVRVDEGREADIVPVIPPSKGSGG